MLPEPQLDSALYSNRVSAVWLDRSVMTEFREPAMLGRSQQTATSWSDSDRIPEY